MFVDGDTPPKNEILIKLDEKISKQIDSSDIKNTNRERTYPNFMEFNFQIGFRSLVSKFIYSWKNKFLF